MTYKKAFSSQGLSTWMNLLFHCEPACSSEEVLLLMTSVVKAWRISARGKGLPGSLWNFLSSENQHALSIGYLLSVCENGAVPEGTGHVPFFTGSGWILVSLSAWGRTFLSEMWPKNQTHTFFVEVWEKEALWFLPGERCHLRSLGHKQTDSSGTEHCRARMDQFGHVVCEKWINTWKKGLLSAWPILKYYLLSFMSMFAFARISPYLLHFSKCIISWSCGSSSHLPSHWSPSDPL